jgi:ATP adenylyltransferase
VHLEQQERRTAAEACAVLLAFLRYAVRGIALAPSSGKARCAMDYIWTPWRYQYMKDVQTGEPPECIFCDAAERKDDAETLVVYRGAKTFVILNRYPYTSGHVMIVPYAHVAELSACDAEALSEMTWLAQRVEGAYRANYQPDGMNLGMNLGRAAGAGVIGHLHLHVLPRWFGDSNFMTVAGETRVHPEELRTTYERLRKALASGASGERP